MSVVHNGIIENHEHLRAQLKSQGYVFASETDTEVIAHLIHSRLMASTDNTSIGANPVGAGALMAAVAGAVSELEGAYAIAVISTTEPNTVVGSRKGSPLLLGIGQQAKGENFLASDTSALLQVTRQVAYLEDGDVVEIRPDQVRIQDASGRTVERAAVQSQLLSLIHI